MVVQDNTTVTDDSKEIVKTEENNKGLTTPEAQETVADALARLRSKGLIKANEKDEEESTTTDDSNSDDEKETKEKEASITDETKKSEALKAKSEKVLKLFPDGEEDAEVAASIFDKFSGNEFKINEFLSTLEGVSKKRVSELKAHLKSQVIEDAKKDVLEELGLEGVSSTDYQMFRRFLEAGGTLAMLGNLKDDDIPENLKVDGNGNPLTDEQIEFFRDVKKQVKTANERADKLEARLNKKDQTDKKSAVQKQVDDFSAERIASLDSVIDDLKLTDDQADEFVQLSLYHFSKDKKLVKLWADAIEAKISDDGIMARKLARQVDIQLSKIAEKSSKRFSDSVKTESETKKKELEAATEKERKELSESGGAVVATGRTKFKINPDRPFDVGDATRQFNQMKKDGLIKSV